MQESRNKAIIRTSIIGIAANILLAGFKAVIGLLTHSIAIVLDAVNSLSDALSSVITIVGTKLAAKAPDKKHPLGYGRIEYLSAMIVAAIVLYAGITSGVESIKKIISPETAEYNKISLIIIAVAVLAKLLLGTYVKKVGKKVNSGALTASGSDALFDAILSLSVLASAILFMTTGISLEAYVGVIIAIVIIKAGIEMLMETLDEILGKRVERDYLKDIRQTICEEELVQGAYDLILHSYGPDKYIGSVHIEVPDTLTADQIDLLERKIAENVFLKHGVMMTGIGIYSVNTKNDTVAAMRSDIMRMVSHHDGVMQIHGFYVNLDKKTIHFDVILDFECEDRKRTFEEIKNQVAKAYPDFSLQIALDIDF